MKAVFLYLLLKKEEFQLKIYNYRQHVAEDIAEYLQDSYPEINKDTIQGISFDDFYDEFYDQLINVDCITGNGSGSYTFNTLQAEQNLVGNWDLLRSATEEFDPSLDILAKGPEVCDVILRIYVLSDALRDVYNGFM